MVKTIINKEVVVTAVGFKRDLTMFPRQMEYEGRTYDFIDAGLSCMVRSGERLSQILTLTDGRAQFRLRSDSRQGGIWTLLSMSA
ncbi:MAG: hypothetical protein ACSLEY_03665 [Candidatus Saccharimonadales bacterium]